MACRVLLKVNSALAALGTNRLTPLNVTQTIGSARDKIVDILVSVEVPLAALTLAFSPSSLPRRVPSTDRTNRHRTGF